MRSSVLFLLLLPAWPQAAWAGELPSMTSALLRTTWGLLVVVGLILIIYGLVRKRFGMQTSSPGDRIQLIEVRQLMPRASVALIQVDQRQLLVGISQEQVTLLTTLDSGDSQFADILDQQQ